MKHQASCSCGQLKLTFIGEITRSSICHCLACQQRTGSAFGIQTRLERGNVSIEGNFTKYERPTDEGDHVKFSFCPTCGSTVFWEIDDLPDSIIVAVGAFANPEFLAPHFLSMRPASITGYSCQIRSSSTGIELLQKILWAGYRFRSRPFRNASGLSRDRSG
jgi:hypothetical protein